MLASQVIFKGQMEYAIILISVGEKIFSWLFHLLLFIFYGSDVIRQIDYNIIFGWWFIPIMAIS
jgi:hypothetical protein